MADPTIPDICEAIAYRYDMERYIELRTQSPKMAVRPSAGKQIPYAADRLLTHEEAMDELEQECPF